MLKENEKVKIIIYGTGKRAGLALDILRGKYSEQEIVGFTNSCNNSDNQKIFGKKVYNFSEIVSLYRGEEYYYISPAEPTRSEIQVILEKKGIDRTHILNYEEVEENCIGCEDLDDLMVVGDDALYFCCSMPGQNIAPSITYRESIYETVDAFLNEKNDIIRQLKQSSGPCYGCVKTVRGGIRKSKKTIDRLSIGLSYPCQLACSYCTWHCNSRNIKKYGDKQVKKAYQIDVKGLIQYLEQKGVFSDTGTIFIASGEITISAKRDELLDAVGNHPLCVMSNGIVFNKRIAQKVARMDGSHIEVSIDAGTRETYKKVKGLDAFEKVKETLHLYKQEGANIYLKYIMLDINCTDNDIQGFCGIIKSIGPQNISISFDYNCGQNISQNVLRGIAKLSKEINKLGLVCIINPAIGKKNIEEINRCIDLK